MALPMSVIFLTFNSEAYIEASLRSVVEWAGELFVVDSGSTDDTLDIVKRYTNNIMHHPFENYAKQRNWAQHNLPLSYEWVFHLDADEQVTPALWKALLDFYDKGDHQRTDGLLTARRVVFLGKWIRHGGMYPVYHHRIFRRDKGRCEEKLYDQHFVVQGTTRVIKGDIIDLVTPDLDTWMKNHIRWAGLEAHQQSDIKFIHEKNGVINPKFTGTLIEKRRWARVSLYGRGPLFIRAIGYFFYRYFLRLGFLDGTEGLIYHTLQGFWFRFYVDALVWESQKKQDGSK